MLLLHVSQPRCARRRHYRPSCSGLVSIVEILVLSHLYDIFCNAHHLLTPIREPLISCSVHFLTFITKRRNVNTGDRTHIQGSACLRGSSGYRRGCGACDTWQQWRSMLSQCSKHC